MGKIKNDTDSEYEEKISLVSIKLIKEKGEPNYSFMQKVNPILDKKMILDALEETIDLVKEKGK
ncbi:MAG: hypothetical protein ABIH64_02585 [Nanoarchaeota archaeon]